MPYGKITTAPPRRKTAPRAPNARTLRRGSMLEVPSVTRAPRYAAVGPFLRCRCDGRTSATQLRQLTATKRTTLRGSQLLRAAIRNAAEDQDRDHEHDGVNEHRRTVGDTRSERPFERQCRKTPEQWADDGGNASREKHQAEIATRLDV